MAPPKGVPKPLIRNESDMARARALQVRAMASTKTSAQAMAEILGISVKELRRQYYKEMKQGHDYVYAAMSMKLVNAGMSGDIRAILAWLRKFGGWEEITRREITGKNGEPISFRNLDAVALASVIEALSTQSNAGRGAGRIGTQIDVDRARDVDLDAVPGAADEGAE